MWLQRIAGRWLPGINRVGVSNHVTGAAVHPGADVATQRPTHRHRAGIVEDGVVAA